MRSANFELISTFVAYLRDYRCTPEGTVLMYERDLRHFATWLHIPVQDATRIQVQLYVGDSLKQGASRQTVTRRLARVNHFYRFLMGDGKIRSNPAQGLTMPTHWASLKGEAQTRPFLTLWIRRDLDAI